MIIPLYDISFKVDDNDVHHESLRHSARESYPIRSPSFHRGKSTRMHVDNGSIAHSSFSRGFSFRSGLSPCCNLVGLDDYPNLNSSKKVCSLSSIRVSKASNLAPTKSTNAIVLLLVLQFEGVVEVGKDFGGSGLRLGRFRFAVGGSNRFGKVRWRWKIRIDKRFGGYGRPLFGLRFWLRFRLAVDSGNRL
ncbi:hypothetical protein B296_00002326 [Ensete ventricosum]|uniref:Uncharacterized protein n=1 Tax=Ensete ventricosum TaxID=4639 RepID=A0A426ZEP7_ENSVE|nr:hypothetical protein B296_00002326 [Ensete ventricosum]